jgi:hypothetical protein
VAAGEPPQLDEPPRELGAASRDEFEIGAHVVAQRIGLSLRLLLDTLHDGVDLPRHLLGSLLAVALERGARISHRLVSRDARLLPGRVQPGAQFGDIETQLLYLLPQVLPLFDGGMLSFLATHELVAHLQ